MGKIQKFLLLLTAIAMVVGCQVQPVTAPIDSPKVQHIRKLTDTARYYEGEGNVKAALEYHKRALQKSKDYGLPGYEAKSLVHIAGILKTDDAEQSLEYLRRALVIAEGINGHELKTDIFLAMSGIYKQQENYQEALKALEAHQKLLARTFAKNRGREIAHIEAEGQRKLERYIYLIVIIFVVLAAILLSVFFFRTRRLNKQLKSSNKIKDKLFSIIGHDLRGPAGGIMDALNMVDAGVLTDAEEKEIIGLLKKQSYSFNETLNTLLSWASTQLHGADTKMAQFDPGKLIQKSVDVLAGQASQKNIKINVNTPEGLSVFADPNHIDFIIRNLLSNAIKFSHANSSIDIVVRSEEQQVIISVADYGIGIPEEKQKQFSLSSNMDSSFGTKGEKGTGLGLMLSKEFIRANQGELWLRSLEKEGTTVFLALQKG
ncbi:MAG: ATP-binding protein [Daejeonella sp.]